MSKTKLSSISVSSAHKVKRSISYKTVSQCISNSNKRRDDSQWEYKANNQVSSIMYILCKEMKKSTEIKRHEYLKEKIIHCKLQHLNEKHT